ncbi:lipopolysaccharide assembly protein LapA domain-containing protein [Pseudomonas frederiksbergensis]|uniref:lipopolysaccharide assembly protein LapA domain-containing protein n=1 Tax=Pseudomonas frederiksbergensis TaxID=104087 RepID=UPI000F474399|nr:lipopolysaccharide assembly protein LapA domain-containing protein [Pseudomonas frederiksbergensis]
MNSFKKVALGLFLLAVFVIVLVFMLENQQLTSISFLGMTTQPLPVSVFVATFLLGGILLGPLLAMVFKRKRSRI